MLIDTHCHLTYPELAARGAALLDDAAAAGVERCITVATDADDAQRACALASRDPRVYLAAGIHPHQAGAADNAALATLEALHDDPAGRGIAGKLVAVGETGLDFHYDFAPRDRQYAAFEAQLDLAERVGRPVIIHARSSESEVLEVLAGHPGLADRVVFHCFSGDAALAERVLTAGFWLSFTGVVTFRSADAIRSAARITPKDRIMIETDAPYLTPEPHRKVRPNEPRYAADTARFVAELRGVGYEEFAAQTTRNAERFFGLGG